MSRTSFLVGLPRVTGLVALVAGVCGAGVFGGACSSTSTNAGADGGPVVTGPDASDGSVSTVDGGNGPLGFALSNVDLSGIDLSKVGDFIVDDACTVNTDINLASCGDGANVLGFKVATQSDGTKVGVYVARSMTIPAGKSLTVEGSLPLVFIALETISIGGSLDGSSREDVGIAGGQTQKTKRTKGAGVGGGGAGTAVAASGGGSYCGIGGAGGAESGAVTPGGVAYGTPEISPLAPGSSGGAADGSGGSGGGAIQLVAGTSITIEATGAVAVGAGGGGFGGISGQEANGGGSGGAILIESLAVTVAGTLAANGGGGGAGTSSDVGAAPPLDPGGANATPNATPAAGGKAGVGPSSGGNGSAAASVDGTAGAFTAGNAAGGGGGGAGRIRINTKSAQATLSGTLSPSASTACATQGTVHFNFTR